MKSKFKSHPDLLKTRRGILVTRDTFKVYNSDEEIDTLCMNFINEDEYIGSDVYALFENWNGFWVIISIVKVL